MPIGSLEKGDYVRLKPHVQFKPRSPKGVVRFAYDADPPAYEVEFFWDGSSLGEYYMTEDELEPLGMNSEFA